MRRDPADEEEELYLDNSSEPPSEEETEDLLTLLDRLEHELTSAGRIPMTGRLVVNEEAVYAILDRIRTVGQAGIRQARAIVRHREQIVTESQQEAERIIEEAAVQAEAQSSSAGLAKRAERRSRELLDDAERRAREIEAEADQYAGQVLLKLRERRQQMQSLLQEGGLSPE